MDEQTKSEMLAEVGSFLKNAAHCKPKAKPTSPMTRPSAADSRRKWRLTGGVIEEVPGETDKSGAVSDKE